VNRTSTPHQVVTLRIPPGLNRRVTEAVEQTGLKRSDVLRLAVARGLERVLELRAFNEQVETSNELA
jgi:hypothetical protein